MVGAMPTALRGHGLNPTGMPTQSRGHGTRSLPTILERKVYYMSPSIDIQKFITCKHHSYPGSTIRFPVSLFGQKSLCYREILLARRPAIKQQANVFDSGFVIGQFQDLAR